MKDPIVPQHAEVVQAPTTQRRRHAAIPEHAVRTLEKWDAYRKGERERIEKLGGATFETSIEVDGVKEAVTVKTGSALMRGTILQGIPQEHIDALREQYLALDKQFAPSPVPQKMSALREVVEKLRSSMRKFGKRLRKEK